MSTFPSLNIAKSGFKRLRLSTSTRNETSPAFTAIRHFNADQALDLSGAPPSAASSFPIPGASSTSTGAESAEASTSSTPTHYLITLHRSSIGLPSPIHGALRSLGFGHSTPTSSRHRAFKLHQSVLHPHSADIAGQILKVKELVRVRNVTEGEGLRVMLRGKGEGRGVGERGWEVMGRAVGGGKGVEV